MALLSGYPFDTFPNLSVANEAEMFARVVCVLSLVSRQCNGECVVNELVCLSIYLYQFIVCKHNLISGIVFNKGRINYITLIFSRNILTTKLYALFTVT